MGEKARDRGLTVAGNPSGPAATRLSPPRKLGKSGLDLWNSIQSEFQIADSGGVALLMQACQAADRVQALSDQIDADGLTIRSKAGLRAHPCLRDEIAGRSFIVRTLAKLGVTDESIKPMGRPPTGGIGWRGPLYGDE